MNLSGQELKKIIENAIKQGLEETEFSLNEEQGLSDQQKQFLQNHPDPEGALLYWKSFGDSLEKREAVEILADRLGLEKVAEILGKDKEKNAAMLAALEKKLKRQNKAAERTGMYTNTSSNRDMRANADVTLGTNRTSKAPTGLGESKKYLKEELTKDEIKKIIKDEIAKELRQDLKTMVEDELKKVLKDRKIKNEIGDISKEILKKLYKDLSIYHTYVIDRVKM